MNAGFSDEPKRPFPEHGAQLVYELARDRVAIQMSKIDALDAKLSQSFGLATAIVALAIAAISIQADPAEVGLGIPGGSAVFWAFLGTGVVTYFAFATWSISAYWVKVWGYGPTLREAWGYSRKYSDPDQMYWWAADVYTRAFDENEKAAEPKVRAAKWGSIFLVSELTALAISILFSF